MSDRNLSDFTGRDLATSTGRSQSDASGREVRAEQNQEFPWTFPLWFTDMKIRDAVTFGGRDLSNG